MLVSVGERITGALAAMAISDLGHDAISLTGSQAGIVTDTVHGKAKIVDIRGRRIHEALDAGKIVLVAGFQGVSTDFEVTTLGRGGSDVTAVALAAAVGADACEIYTDVDGVFTADPRVVPTARKLHAVSYDEMLEMAASGAKVLQLRSVEFARNHDVMLHVRSTFTDEPGTWIREEDERMLEKAMISGVTHTVEEAVYEVRDIAPADLFEALSGASVNVDTVIQIDGSIVFSTPIEDKHGRRGRAREARGELDRADRARQGQRRRRRHAEQPRRGRERVRDAALARRRAALRLHLADQDRLLRAARRRRALGAGAPRDLRAVRSRGGACPCLTRASASSARPARSGP